TELERRQLAADARQTGAILRSLLEHTREAILLIGPDLRIEAMNRRMQELFAYPEALLREATRGDIIRHNIEKGEYGPGDPKEQLRRRVEIATSPEPHLYEHRRPDGRIIEVQGRPLGNGGFLRTITEVSAHRRIEAALRESERRYRVVAEMTSDLIFSYVVEGEDFVPEWMAGTPLAERLGVPHP